MDFLEEKLKFLPKIELHAHLTGSVHISTIIDLIRNESEKLELEKYQKNGITCLKDAFLVFSFMHQLLNNKENLIRITKEVLLTFQKENTVYLELRTTPRQIYDTATNKVILSKLDYINTVLDVIKEFEKQNEMIVRLILSIDRAKPIQDAYETVELCNQLKDRGENYVVGIDISGNPEIGNLLDIKDLFHLIKANNLKLTIHIAEIADSEDENEFILKHIRPDRVGHAVFLSNHLKDFLHENPLPIEICPTSNLFTKSVLSIDKHPFIDFYSKDKTYPLCICTDDCGMFSTSITSEQYLVAKTFKLTLNNLYDLNKNSMKIIFDQSETTINKLNTKFEEFKQKHLF